MTGGEPVEFRLEVRAQHSRSLDEALLLVSSKRSDASCTGQRVAAVSQPV